MGGLRLALGFATSKAVEKAQARSLMLRPNDLRISPRLPALLGYSKSM